MEKEAKDLERYAYQYHCVEYLSLSIRSNLNLNSICSEHNREAPSVTVRSFVITSRVLPSPPFVVWPVVVVSSVFPDWFTKKLVVSWRFSLKTWFGIPSLIPNTPVVRLSRLWTLSTPWSDRERPFTVSEVKKRPTYSINAQKASMHCRSTTGYFNTHSFQTKTCMNSIVVNVTVVWIFVQPVA